MLLQLRGYPPQRQALRGTPFFIIRSINIPAGGSKPCEESHNIYIYIYIYFIGSYTDRKKEKETIAEDEDEEGKEKKIHQEKKKVLKL